MHTRRNFIKISSLGIGATAIAGGTIQWAVGASSKKRFRRIKFGSYFEKGFHLL